MKKEALVVSQRAVYMCKPAFGGEVDDEGWYGHIVTVKEELNDNWFRIITPYGYETNAYGEDLMFDEAEIARAKEAKRLRVWHTAGDVQTDCTHNGSILITLFRGAIVEPVEDDTTAKGWQKVRLYGGREGYIRAKFLGDYYEHCELGEEELRASVVKLAMTYMGTQYRWGGKTPEGIDCSGLVGSAYLMYGVNLYRNASIEEGYAAHKIDRANMKAGDLLFFKGHVAMYIGDGMFIHSTSRAGDDGVVLASLCPGDPLYRDLAKEVLYVGSIF